MFLSQLKSFKVRDFCAQIDWWKAQAFKSERFHITFDKRTFRRQLRAQQYHYQLAV
jgi:hypothetical protein